MKIVKTGPKVKPPPKQVHIRFYEAEYELLDRLDAVAKKADLAREPFIKAVLSTALNDPKFVLKVRG